MKLHIESRVEYLEMRAEKKCNRGTRDWTINDEDETLCREYKRWFSNVSRENMCEGTRYWTLKDE